MKNEELRVGSVQCVVGGIRGRVLSTTHLLFFIFLLLPLVANAYSFKKETESGQTLYYDITSPGKVMVVNPDWGQNAPPEGDLIIPDTVYYATVPYLVTAIGQDAFSLCTGLTSVVVPEGVTSIGSFAFYSCSSLTSVTLPTTLTEIRSQAFYGTALIADSSNWDSGGLLYINRYLIASRPEVDSVLVIRDSTLGLGAMSLYYNQCIRVVVLPESLRFIGGLAFADCANIDTIQLIDSVPPDARGDSFERASAFTVKVPCGSANAYRNHSVWGQYTVVEYGCTNPPDDPPGPPDNPDDPPDNPDDPNNPPDNPDDPPQPVDPSDPNDEVDAWTEDGGLVIHVSEGAEIYVFDIDSHVIFHTVATSNVLHVPLANSGIYIVRREGAPFPEVVSYTK